MKYSKRTIILWICQIAAAVIVLQTLWFKFTGAPESVAIFTKLGWEPVGRYLVGIAELIAGVLLLIPRSAVYGAVLTTGLMIGAMIAHITVLGVDSIFLALIVFVLAVTVLVMRWKELPIVGTL